MAQESWVWGGTTVGDGTLAPYDNDEWTDLWRKFFQLDHAAQGPLGRYLNELAISTPGGASLNAATGGAFVDGKFYESDAVVALSPVSGATVYWLVGLVKNFAAQTVRLFTRGTYASRALALASLVQTAATWEIPLATVLTTAGGNVDTIRDEREFVVSPLAGMQPIHDEYYAANSANGATLTIDNIPQCFSHLKLRMSVNGPGTAFYLWLNNDTGNNYRQVNYAWDDTGFDGAASGIQALTTLFIMRGPESPAANRNTFYDIDIHNYAKIDKERNVIMRSNTIVDFAVSGSPEYEVVHGVWMNQADPITRIDLEPWIGSLNWGAGSRVTLHGII